MIKFGFYFFAKVYDKKNVCKFLAKTQICKIDSSIQALESSGKASSQV
jgi:hypothetical protein